MVFAYSESLFSMSSFSACSFSQPSAHSLSAFAFTISIRSWFPCIKPKGFLSITGVKELLSAASVCSCLVRGLPVKILSPGYILPAVLITCCRCFSASLFLASFSAVEYQYLSAFSFSSCLALIANILLGSFQKSITPSFFASRLCSSNLPAPNSASGGIPLSASLAAFIAFCLAICAAIVAWFFSVVIPVGLGVLTKTEGYCSAPNSASGGPEAIAASKAASSG